MYDKEEAPRGRVETYPKIQKMRDVIFERHQTQSNGDIFYANGTTTYQVNDSADYDRSYEKTWNFQTFLHYLNKSPLTFKYCIIQT